jgi:hypothetical protein
VITRRALVLGSLATAAITARAAHAQGTHVLTATDVHVPGYPTVEAIKWIDQTLRRETGERLGIRLYHSGQLGRESDSIDLVRFGALDMTRVFGAALNNPFPLTRILSLPFVFESTPHLRRAVDGPIGREILEGFAARGLVGLALYDSGARSIYNTRRAVHEPADLHGLKLRVPPSDIFMGVVRGLGRESHAAALRRGLFRAPDAPDRRRREQLAELPHDAPVRGRALLVRDDARLHARSAAVLAPELRRARAGRPRAAGRGRGAVRADDARTVGRVRSEVARARAGARRDRATRWTGPRSSARWRRWSEDYRRDPRSTGSTAPSGSSQ